PRRATPPCRPSALTGPRHGPEESHGHGRWFDCRRNWRGRGVRNRTAVIGGLLATATGIAWGGQFVVGKSALGSVDAFPLSTVRYALAASLWLLLLVGIEGRRALRLDGRGLRLLWLGSL